jgi:DMSO/TMAO reductase YedYZ molybdopterin-dependent catalytic subunit
MLSTNTSLIPQQTDPDNLESPPSAFETFLTPNDLFYVRNHFACPRIEQRTWRLRVRGALKPLEFTLEEIMQFPSHTVTATLECAGNGRALLAEQTSGVQWERGAVGTAEWTGVSLSLVLEQAGITPEDCEVVLTGADGGQVDEPLPSPGPIHFARSLPVVKALEKDVILAYRMNGEQLPNEHGFPLRAIVPGWYGMASVKWLTDVTICKTSFHGFYQTAEYSYWERTQAAPTLRPLRQMLLKAQITSPLPNELLPVSSNFQIRGVAWAGESEIAMVEVTVDGGNTWAEAQLLDRPKRYTWVRFEVSSPGPNRPGKLELRARAWNREGCCQAHSRNQDYRSYAVRHVVPVVVEFS